MSFITALSLSLNNLLTKKGRTVLVSIAGSIGIIGIALILSVSTGFQNYVDSIQEETLTSYPLTIMKESFDITTLLMGMDTNQDDEEEVKVDNEKVLERQIMTKTLSSIKSNDIKAFKKYLTDHKKDYENDVSTVSYMYSIDPNIYTYDSTNTLVKVNPSNLFSSIYSSNITSSVGNMGSVFQPMLNNQNILNDQYDVLKGKWPEKYDELVLVLPNKDSIPDLITYSLGFRDNKELTEMVQSIFRGESSNVKHDSLKLTYDELLNKELKLILPSSLYKFNNKYDVYEDMSEDEQYMKDLYKKALTLKIVGIVTTKEGVSAGSLDNGIAYRQDLIDYIIDESSKTDIVKKQLKNKDVDVFSGNKFDDKKNTGAFTFQDLVSVDEKKLKDVFKVNISEEDMKKDSEKYINNINAAITTDTNPALTKYTESLNTVLNNFVNYLDVDKYLSSNEVNNLVNSLEKEYYIPGDTYKTIYKGLLTGVLTAYNTAIEAVPEPMRNSMKNQIYTQIVSSVKTQPEIGSVALQMAKTMTETKMRVIILQNVGDMTANITSKLGNAFNVDPAKFASAFKLNFSEDELMRVVTAMNTQESTADTNLVQLGYQDKESPSVVAIYFSSFDGKENFVKFIKDYNDSVDEEAKINYSDITGALMSSVKTIVNAVSYVLIAFVSISLVVSSIMIGIITYISVYERTKEIGILRAIGASKRNVSSIFNAETFIIGFLSGLFGIGITYIMIPIINRILVGLTNNVNIKAMLNPTSAFCLVLLSIILTLIGGIIPAKAAAKRDPVIALRTE
jgi:ABC-type lipoprotein release transport system permease subunit